MSTHVVKLRPWLVPNFATVEGPPRTRQEGISAAEGIPLSELSPETLDAMCNEFRAGVFRKAGKPDPKEKK